MSNNNYTINTQAERDQWKLIRDQATVLIESNALPMAIKKPEQAIAIIQYGRELGYLPMTSLQNISLIQGKPTLSANLIGAMLKRAGYDFWVKIYSDKKVEIVFKNLTGREQAFSYTMDEAVTAGNTSKDNYRKYSAEMLYARCLTRGGRIVAPEVLAGVYAPEEFETNTETKQPTVEPRKVEAITDEPKVEAQEGEIVDEVDRGSQIQEAMNTIAAVMSMNELLEWAKKYKEIMDEPSIKEAGANRKAQLTAEIEEEPKAEIKPKKTFKERVEDIQKVTDENTK